jgi:hypothetical protein
VSNEEQARKYYLSAALGGGEEWIAAMTDHLDYVDKLEAVGKAALVLADEADRSRFEGHLAALEEAVAEAYPNVEQEAVE